MKKTLFLYVKKWKNTVYPCFQIIALLVFVAVNISGCSRKDSAFPSGFSHLDAGEEGTFNIGLALGGIVRSFDEDINKEVLKFDYWASKGTFVGVWTNDYPPELGRDTVDAIKIGVKAPDANQLQEVSVKLEVKGTKAKQNIPLYLGTDWSYVREAIDWNRIGALEEIVFVLSPMSVAPKGTNPILFSPVEAGPADAGEKVEGLLYFDVDFYKLTFLQKNLIFVKIGLIFVISILAAWMVDIFGKRS
ncbi:MAG: hypothetical protein JSV93_02545 [Candidatus Omnitrophota bacterium]|nr:MAG: hypothetical protein JSV93_02545 [Candidatus Omnitrophota bacterium]